MNREISKMPRKKYTKEEVYKMLLESDSDNDEDESDVELDDSSSDESVVALPDSILNYNQMMGGVDKSDQLIEPYDPTRKSMVWYKKLAIHLFQLAMLNAHTMYTKSQTGEKLSFLQFTQAVIKLILCLVTVLLKSLILT